VPGSNAPPSKNRRDEILNHLEREKVAFIIRPRSTPRQSLEKERLNDPELSIGQESNLD
jgi:hypothetical protein